MDEALARQLWPQRLFGSMFAVFASIAMLLATCGLYAVTAYAVSRRTREIGVRVALGADARSVWWAVTGTTLRQLAIGLVLGMAGAAGVATILPAFLVGTGGANVFALPASPSCWWRRRGGERGARAPRDATRPGGGAQTE